MGYHPDMEDLRGNWIAVGWLHPDHEYPRGPVPADFLPKLREIVGRWGESASALGCGYRMGLHTCEFCERFHRGGTFGVPYGDRLFYVPEMIVHYIEQHGYSPPSDFIEAVLACPLPGTPEYEAAASRFRLR